MTAGDNKGDDVGNVDNGDDGGDDGDNNGGDNGREGDGGDAGGGGGSWRRTRRRRRWQQQWWRWLHIAKAVAFLLQRYFCVIFLRCVGGIGEVTDPLTLLSRLRYVGVLLGGDRKCPQ
jgi:hypothetical protein